MSTYQKAANDALATLDRLETDSEAINQLGPLCKQAGLGDDEAVYLVKFARSFEEVTALSTEDLVKRALRKFLQGRDSDAIYRGISLRQPSDSVKCAAACEMLGIQDLRERPEDAALAVELEKRAIGGGIRALGQLGRSMGRAGRSGGSLIRGGSRASRPSIASRVSGLRGARGGRGVGEVAGLGTGRIGGVAGAAEAGGAGAGGIGNIGGGGGAGGAAGGGWGRTALGVGAGGGAGYGLSELSGPSREEMQREFFQQYAVPAVQSMARQGDIPGIVDLIQQAKSADIPPELWQALARAMHYNRNSFIPQHWA